MKAITAENLSKVYESGTVTVRGFSLDEGEIFGFLGPNGAGKTTTVKLLFGVSRSEYEERAKQLPAPA
ncbi:MAG: ATP-binding cassette domain-containing protein [Oscillospiraceae bacterium]